MPGKQVEIIDTAQKIPGFLNRSIQIDRAVQNLAPPLPNISSDLM
jgi:hypothetical protein